MYSVSVPTSYGFIIAIKIEGIAPQFELGTNGFTNRHHAGATLCDMFPTVNSFPTCTRAERNAFIARHFPHTAEYEAEQADLSLMSANL